MDLVALSGYTHTQSVAHTLIQYSKQQGVHACFKDVEVTSFLWQKIDEDVRQSSMTVMWGAGAYWDGWQMSWVIKSSEEEGELLHILLNSFIHK